MRGFKPVNGSNATLAPEQLELEQLLREQNRVKALQVVKSYAKGEQWTQEDQDIIMMALGLMESPPPLENRSRR
jgi:predicted nucleotidyltransferase